MKTDDNRAAVAAQTIRASIARLRQPVDLVNSAWKGAAMSLTDRIGNEARVLAGVAEELEAAAVVMHERSRAISASPLRETERATLLIRINDTLRFLGAPGDWGYGTRLGDLTLELLWLRQQLQNSAALESEARVGA